MGRPKREMEVLDALTVVSFMLAKQRDGMKLSETDQVLLAEARQKISDHGREVRLRWQRTTP